jgi:hypothetical protein
MAVKIPCGKSRPATRPYEVWANESTGWEWHVLKKWQADDNKPYARWFCLVKSPFVPQGEIGDVYVREIKEHSRLVRTDYDVL